MSYNGCKMKIRKKLVNCLVFLLIFFLVTPAQCFTIGEEREVGEKLLYSIRSTFTVIEEPDIAAYLAGLGSEILDVAGLQFFDYRYYVVESDDFNAFAAPSGLIFFYTGLIKQMNSEDQLCSVLAHEIGHVVRRHLASRIEKGNVVTIASLGLALASLALGNAKATAALFTGSLAAGQSAQLSFSRENEEEADLLAYDWMKELGRSPVGQEEMLQTMRRIARYKSSQVPQYLLTHPNPEARLDYVQGLMGTETKIVEPQDSIADDFDFFRFKYRVMSMLEDKKEIRTYLASILANDTSDEMHQVYAKYGMAQLERQENNFPRSLELLEEVIAKYPDRDILQIDKGVILSEAGDADQATALLEKLYNKRRNDNYCAYSLGEAYLRAGNTKRAKQLLEQVAMSMKEFAAVYYELGKIASSEKEVAKTAFYLGEYNLYLGKLKLAKFNFDSALKAVDLDPKTKKNVEQYQELIKKLEKK